MQLLHRNVQRFRGGLVLKAHRPLYHSTVDLRVIKKKKKKKPPTRDPCALSRWSVVLTSKTSEIIWARPTEVTARLPCYDKHDPSGFGFWVSAVGCLTTTWPLTISSQLGNLRWYGGLRSHLESLIIYKLSSRKFTIQNDLC